ncbi:MAG: hypothetical protein WCC32_08550 [Terriglobales bacterium]
MLPILVVLFVVSYCLLTMLVFEQGQTIESQRTLIRAMLQDSTQLAAIKGKLAAGQFPRSQASASADQKNDQRNDQKSADPKNDPKNAQKNSAAAPLISGKTKQAKPPRTMMQMPGKPESDLEDVRRSTRMI